MLESSGPFSQKEDFQNQKQLHATNEETAGRSSPGAWVSWPPRPTSLVQLNGHAQTVHESWALH